jgi:hypothetical protein
MRSGLFGKTLEDALQTLLQKYPQVIPGKQIDPSSDDPARFVLLRREMPLGGWSLDHLYVDQRAILTLVETKLIQNSESRREVIGQIIEYAANATEFWGSGRARQHAAEFWSKQGEVPPRELDEILKEEFGDDLDVENFWNSVESNLSHGQIRLIIAADELRPEVRRMIEYLNNEMQNAEVLGLELRCYGDETKSLVLVPRLVGQTQASVDRRSGGDAVFWTVDKLRNAYQELSDTELGARLQKLLDWAVTKKCFMETRTKFPSFSLRGKNDYRFVSFSIEGNMYLIINEKHYLDGANERDELVNELKILELLDPNLDPETVNSGRNLSRKLSEIDDDSVDKLLELFAKHSN